MNARTVLRAISVETTLEAEDAVAEMLGRLLGCPASAFFDVEARISRVCVYQTGPVVPGLRAKVKEGLDRIRDCGLDISPARISIAGVRKEDWAESWKRHFKPIEIGTELLVKPGWSKRKPRKDQVVVILDPGLSFGTGQHPTTAYCLKEIARYSGARSAGTPPPGLPKNGHSLLDLGTGSGILAISAAKLGYTPVRALDFDAEAVRAAKANARGNGVKIRIVRGDATRLPARPGRRFNFICANLISGLLVSERKRIRAQMERGGILVVAGILKQEFSEVSRAYQNLGLKLVRTKSEREWKSGTFCSQ